MRRFQPIGSFQFDLNLSATTVKVSVMFSRWSRFERVAPVENWTNRRIFFFFLSRAPAGRLADKLIWSNQQPIDRKKRGRRFFQWKSLAESTNLVADVLSHLLTLLLHFAVLLFASILGLADGFQPLTLRLLILLLGVSIFTVSTADACAFHTHTQKNYSNFIQIFSQHSTLSTLYLAKYGSLKSTKLKFKFERRVPRTCRATFVSCCCRKQNV